MAAKAAPAKQHKPAGPTPVETETPIETREQKLLRIANRRVPKAIKAISMIGNLAAYKPTQEDVDSIMSALGEMCALVEARLRGNAKQTVGFTLRTVK